MQYIYIYMQSQTGNRTTPRAAVSLAIHPRFIVHRRRKSNSGQLNWWISLEPKSRAESERSSILVAAGSSFQILNSFGSIYLYPLNVLFFPFFFRMGFVNILQLDHGIIVESEEKRCDNKRGNYWGNMLTIEQKNRPRADAKKEKNFD